MKQGDVVTSKVEHLMTVVELEALPDDGNVYELIEGELFVSPAPGIPHQLILQRLQVELWLFLQQHPIGRLVPGAGLELSQYNSVIPDISFVTNERWNEVVANSRFVFAPNLVVEILSPGQANRNRDLISKRRLYAKYGVEEYWIVDGDKREIIIFQLLDGDLEKKATLSSNELLTSQLLIGFSTAVASIFSDLP